MAVRVTSIQVFRNLEELRDRIKYRQGAVLVCHTVWFGRLSVLAFLML